LGDYYKGLELINYFYIYSCSGGIREQYCQHKLTSDKIK
jgi:hypothetical protein